MSLRKDTLWTSADILVSSGLAFAFRLLLARWLSPVDYGIAAMVLATWTILQVINEFGLTATLIQKGRDGVDQNLIETTFALSTILSFVLLLFSVLIVAPLSAQYYHVPQVSWLTVILSLGLIAAPFGTLSSALLYRERRFKEIAAVRVAATLAGIIVAAAALIREADAWVVVYQALATQMLSAIGLYYYARWPLRWQLDRAAIRQITGFSTLVFLNDMMVSFAGSLPIVVVGRMLGAAEAGMFAVAVLLTDTMRRSMMAILNRVMFVHYSMNQSTHAALRKDYKSTQYFNCRATFPLMVFVILFAPDTTQKKLSD